MVAGALSMVGREYVSVSSQSDTEEADLARERKELSDNPPLTRRACRDFRQARCRWTPRATGGRAVDNGKMCFRLTRVTNSEISKITAAGGGEHSARCRSRDILGRLRPGPHRGHRKVVWDRRLKRRKAGATTRVSCDVSPACRGDLVAAVAAKDAARRSAPDGGQVAEMGHV